MEAIADSNAAAATTASSTTTTTTTMTPMDENKNENEVEGKKIDTIQKKNRIQVSNTKKPLFFYLNLAKKYIKQHNEVVLSALGMAIPAVVTIAGILKKNGLAIEKEVSTSTIATKDEAKGRMVQKPRIEIVLVKTGNVERLNIAAGESPKQAVAEKESDNSTEELYVMV